ncbi:LmeA family phospholipid-binding protein [Gordonia caeni]|uniref:DUF2993 domain-containing protein n=1 Tax=Gordonia caeni TaxID=1007097 RepID=A0ABP7PR55_9ACTN
MSDEENPDNGGTPDPAPDPASDSAADPTPGADAESAPEPATPADGALPEVPGETPAPDSSAPGTPLPEAPSPEAASDEAAASDDEPTTDSLPQVPAPSVDGPLTVPVTRQLPADDGFASVDPMPGESPPPSEQTPVVRTSPRRRGTWRTVALISAAVVLLVVIAGVGTELYLRNRVTSCLETAFGDLTGTSTSVSVPRGPMLGAWITGEVAWVQVDTNDSASSSAMRLHARADEVSRDGRSAQSLRGTAYVPYDRVRELAGQEGNDGAQIESITGNGADGTLTVESSYRVAFLSVPATVVVTPAVEDGRVVFRVDEAKAFGIGLPNDFAQQLVDQVAEAMLGPMFSEISVDSLEVSDQGIDFAFAGQDVNLQAASQVSGTGGQCGA